MKGVKNGASDKQAPNKTVRYNFRLTEDENRRFLSLVERSGYRENKSKYIVKCVLNDKTVVESNAVLVAKPDLEYVKKLCDFHFQFQKFGNNYNQIVKLCHSRKEDKFIGYNLKVLTQHTRELKGLSERIIKLSEEFKASWSR